MIYRLNACTDLLSQELTPGRDPGLLAADERWRVSVNVGSTRCANYCHLREIKLKFTQVTPRLFCWTNRSCDKRSGLSEVRFNVDFSFVRYKVPKLHNLGYDHLIILIRNLYIYIYMYCFNINQNYL